MLLSRRSSASRFVLLHGNGTAYTAELNSTSETKSCTSTAILKLKPWRLLNIAATEAHAFGFRAVLPSGEFRHWVDRSLCCLYCDNPVFGSASAVRRPSYARQMALPRVDWFSVSRAAIIRGGIPLQLQLQYFGQQTSAKAPCTWARTHVSTYARAQMVRQMSLNQLSRRGQCFRYVGLFLFPYSTRCG